MATIEQVKIIKWPDNEIITDKLAVEEPLQIEVEYSSPTGKLRKEIAVTMRTPGSDNELAAGFLFTEGIINVKDIDHAYEKDTNRLLVVLKENVSPQLKNASRNFYTTSSCGICGKSSIDAIHTISQFKSQPDDIHITPEVICSLQHQLQSHQLIFNETGGIHASVLFDRNGKILLIREDVGRHNALDKLIGNAVLEEKLPLRDLILFLSGRTGFELVQKAYMAGINVIAAVGAPTSLAVEFAKETGITLIGFLRNNRFNIYSGEHRITLNKTLEL